LFARGAILPPFCTFINAHPPPLTSSPQMQNSSPGKCRWIYRKTAATACTVFRHGPVDGLYCIDTTGDKQPLQALDLKFLGRKKTLVL
jgi:hypothetical protein